MKRPVALLVLVLAAAFGVWKVSALFDSPDASAVGLAAAEPGSRASGEEALAPLTPTGLESVGIDTDREQAVPAATDAEASTTPSATTGTLVLRTALADGTPVPGVTAFVSAKHAARLGNETNEYRTDEDGLARAEGLSPGPYSIHCLEGAWKSAEVVASLALE